MNHLILDDTTGIDERGITQGDIVAEWQDPAGRAGLTKVGLFARGRYGVSAGGAVWHSEVANVQVTVRQQRNVWTLERWDRYGRVTFPLDPHTVQALKGWLAAR